MSTICKILDTAGRPLANPQPIAAVVTWSQNDSIAKAFDPAGALIDVLWHARPERIDAEGIILAGFEPLNANSTAVRAQIWKVHPN